MNGRTITILGLLQAGALIFGIVFTGIFRKIGADPRFGVEPGAPVFGGFIMAGYFTQYGGFLAVLIVGWVVWAARSLSGGSRSRASASVVFVSGLALLFALALMGIVCSLLASTPLVRL